MYLKIKYLIKKPRALLLLTKIYFPRRKKLYIEWFRSSETLLRVNWQMTTDVSNMTALGRWLFTSEYTCRTKGRKIKNDANLPQHHHCGNLKSRISYLFQAFKQRFTEEGYESSFWEMGSSSKMLGICKIYCVYPSRRTNLQIKVNKEFIIFNIMRKIQFS